MSDITFVALFEREQDQLRASLQGCSLPKDAKKLQTIVSQYLTQMFDRDGELRMSLTQSEDYILQAAISLLNAQQQMAKAMTEETATTSFAGQPSQSLSSSNNNAENKIKSVTQQKVSGTSAMAASAIGGIGGGIIFGTWGAVFGAIAGTALVLYVSATDAKKQSLNPTPQRQCITTKDTTTEIAVNVNQYVEIIKNICRSLDSLIETFRAQIKRVVHKYESQEKSTLERDYRVILEGIQSLLGYKRGNDASDDKYLIKLQTRIEDLADLLDNYNLEAIDYSSDNSQWFDTIKSEKVSSPKLIAPAIIKDGNVILKGKVFVKPD